MPLLHLDWETFSEAPFGNTKKSVGLWNYASHPTTEVMLAAFAVDDGPVQVLEGFMPRWCVNGVQAHPGGWVSWHWTMGHELLYRMLTDDSYEIAAFNAEFERVIARVVCGIPINPSRFICTMARAWSLSFVGGLDEVAKELGFPPDLQKHARGRTMMQKFSKPRRPSKDDPSRRWWPSGDASKLSVDPEGWAEFKVYAAGDVQTSRSVLSWTDRYPWASGEREAWCLDQEVNDTGWPIDTQLVTNANRIRVEEERALTERLKQLTGVDNPNSRPQMMDWLSSQGCRLPDLQAATVEHWLDRWTCAGCPPSTVAPVLQLRQQVAAAAPKKFDALERNVHEGWLRSSLSFGGGQRTQRWSGRVVQTQNLFSEREYDPDTLADILRYADHTTVNALFDGKVLRVLKGAIRPAIAAPSGYKLVVCDLSSIESRLLGWHSGEERINRLFREGGDTYRDLATRVFNIPLAEVTKDQRTFCKPPELGCGYRLRGGLVRYAESMGVSMTEQEALRIVDIWRESNPAVVDMWKWFDDVVADVVQNNSTWIGYQCKFHRDENFLMITLPSGRTIHYFRPLLQTNDYGSWSLTYMGRYQEEGGRWQRVFTHSGKVTENIIQAVARDILRDALMSARLIEGLLIVGHVHDEIVGLARVEEAERVLQDLTKCMASAGALWALGLLLGAEGHVMTRYRKM